MYNEQPKPFVWTKTTDEILATIARFCHRISDSGHLHFLDIEVERPGCHGFLPPWQAWKELQTLTALI